MSEGLLAFSVFLAFLAGLTWLCFKLLMAHGGSWSLKVRGAGMSFENRIEAEDDQATAGKRESGR